VSKFFTLYTVRDSSCATNNAQAVDAMNEIILAPNLHYSPALPNLGKNQGNPS
jgi:hypothetical protein